MKVFIPIAFLALAWPCLVSGQGYGGGDIGGQVQQSPAQQQISSLPQYEGSSGTNENDENYWWLKDNPFQKPSNHPGVVKADDQSSGAGAGAAQPQTYSSQSRPRAQSPPSAAPAPVAKPSPKPPKKEFKYRPITASYGPGPTPTPWAAADNPCMLRVKSDCHASGGPPPPSPSLNVAEQVPYSSNAYSGNAYNAQQQRPQYGQQQGGYSQAPYQAPQQQGQQQQYNQNQVQNYEEQPPYPGCPAAMLCVPDDWCNATGYSEGRPLSLTPAAKSFRVAVMACTNVETNEVGICCRDPDYKDPWPGQNGDGGHDHQHEHKPQGQQQQYQQPQQQQYKPPQQQYQPPAQQPQQPNAYSAGQSFSRPQAPQQQPSYGSVGQSYSPQPQPQRQPQQQPSYNPSYQQQQPQQPQKSPFSSVGQTYQQPQPQQQQQPSYGARPQPQPQQPTYGAQPQTQQQPTYGAQTYSQQPQQQPQKPQQTAYASAGAGGPSPNPYADADATLAASSSLEDTPASSFPLSYSSTLKKKQPPASPSLVHGDGIPLGFQPDVRLSENPYQSHKPIYIVTSPSLSSTTDADSSSQQYEEFGPSNPQEIQQQTTPGDAIEVPIDPPSQNYELPIFEYEALLPAASSTVPTSTKTASSSEDSTSFLEADSTPSTVMPPKQSDDDLQNVPAPSQRHDPPRPSNSGSSCYENEAEASVIVPIPSQNHEPPPLPAHQVATPPSPAPAHLSLNQQSASVVPVPTPNQNYAPPPPPPPPDDNEDTLPSSQPHLLGAPSQNYQPRPFLKPDVNNPILTSLPSPNVTSAPGWLGIRGSFPSRKRFVEKCPMNMKCLRESYCQDIYPEEGNIDLFDIRVGGAAPSRIKCRQDNLPIDGVCCYLRDDYSSLDVRKPLVTPDLDAVIKKVGPEDSCGMRRSASSHDSGPGSTSFGEFPWQALLFIGSRHCGATIVSRRAVLTSASCVRGVRPETILIRVGEWDPGSAAEAKRHQDLKVDRVLAHPNYTGLSSDLAILFTLGNITFDYHIGRICLPHPSSSYNGDSCISTGWGTSTSRRVTSTSSLRGLRKSHLRFSSKQICQQQLIRHALENSFKASRTSLCAHIEQRDVNICSADDGGPIICEDAATGEYAVVGILTKVASSATCGRLDTPLIYTSVPRLLHWLSNNLP